MSSTETGRHAENVAAEYLRKNSYEIIQQNWKTPKCEIDIVAKKHSCIYFVEVKYRASTRQGGGFDYITSQKQRQMHFAAEVWCAKHRWHGDVSLAAVEVSGHNFIVTNFIDSIY